MTTTPPINNNEIKTTIEFFDGKISNATKNIKKVIRSKDNDTFIVSKSGLKMYVCKNKLDGLECKGEFLGKGYALQEGDKCFTCQFGGTTPKLKLEIEPLLNSPQHLSPEPSKSPYLSPRSRSNSLPSSPSSSIWTDKTDESVVDPFMFTAPKTLKRQGAYIRKKRNFSDGSTSLAKFEVKQPSPTILISEEVNDNNQISRNPSSSSSINPWKGVNGVINNLVGNSFEEYATENSQQILNQELAHMSQRLKWFSQENQKLKKRVAELEAREKNAKALGDIYEGYFETKIEILTK